MQSFSLEDWEQLYEESMVILRNRTENSLPKDQWPLRVSEINPYTEGIRDQEVWMNWTDGFDHFAFYLHVVPPSNNTSNRPSGIIIDDTRSILPRQPYVVNSQPGELINASSAAGLSEDHLHD